MIPNLPPPLTHTNTCGLAARSILMSARRHRNHLISDLLSGSHTYTRRESHIRQRRDGPQSANFRNIWNANNGESEKMIIGCLAGGPVTVITHHFFRFYRRLSIKFAHGMAEDLSAKRRQSPWTIAKKKKNAAADFRNPPFTSY